MGKSKFRHLGRFWSEEAMMEALIGQLYPVIFLARLVTLHVATGRPKKDN
jgi:hypothetical protein